jgi:hypothetical protein
MNSLRQSLNSTELTAFKSEVTGSGVLVSALQGAEKQDNIEVQSQKSKIGHRYAFQASQGN